MSLAIGGREIFQQFDFVSARCFQNREFDLSTGNSRDLTGHFTRLMGAMRKFETENVLPEIERALEIGNCDTGVIRRDNAKRFTRAHDRF